MNDSQQPLSIGQKLKGWLRDFFTGSKNHDEKDETYYIRFGWRVLVIGFGGFVLWASFAPLDKGVVAPGFVITEGQRKTVQNAIGGVIEEILVKDGQQVKAGQLLIRMNDLQANAQTQATRETIEGLKGQIAGLEGAIASKELQIRLIREQLVGLRDLAKEGYVARNRVLDIERQQASLMGELASDRGSLERSRRQLNELIAKLPANEFDLENATIESPVDGSIINLQVFTKGAFVQAGTKLMEVVPENHELIVEAKVPIIYIDKVKVGLPVEMIFSAFNQRTTPRIPGVVVTLYADKTKDEGSPTMDPRIREGYYKVQVKVTEKGMKMLKDHEVRPGMPADVFIVTGERTMMNYLMRPIMDRLQAGMSEE